LETIPTDNNKTLGQVARHGFLSVGHFVHT
jgi:hypothetical protein